MNATVNRRRFVAGMGAVFVSPVTGCLSSDDTGEPPEGTAALPVRFWLERAPLPSAEQASVDAIVFADLSSDEQEIVQTALDEEAYTAESGSEPPAVERLRERIEQRTGPGETLVAYLRRADSYYRIGFADGDHIIADPDH